MTDVVVVSGDVIQVATVGIQGPAGAPGPDGPQGDIGLTGPKGDTGPEGPQATAAPVLQGTVYMSAASNATIVLLSSAAYPFTIRQISNLVTGSGIITLSILVNGVPVTGLSNLAVTNSPQSPLATANNAVAVGGRVTMVLSGGTLAADLEFTMTANT